MRALLSLAVEGTKEVDAATVAIVIACVASLVASTAALALCSSCFGSSTPKRSNQAEIYNPSHHGGGHLPYDYTERYPHPSHQGGNSYGSQQPPPYSNRPPYEYDNNFTGAYSPHTNSDFGAQYSDRESYGYEKRPYPMNQYDNYKHILTSGMHEKPGYEDRGSSVGYRDPPGGTGWMRSPQEVRPMQELPSVHEKRPEFDRPGKEPSWMNRSKRSVDFNDRTPAMDEDYAPRNESAWVHQPTFGTAFNDRPGPEHQRAAQEVHILEPADSSLEALEVVLHQVCNKMGGRIKERSTIVQNSIRLGRSAVVCDIQNEFNNETLLLFPDNNRRVRHMRVYEKPGLRDCMPLVATQTDPFQYQLDGRRVMLPCGIFVSRVATLETKLTQAKLVRERQVELFNMFIAIGKVLKRFHQMNLFVRDVSFENIVQARLGDGRSDGWSLLEFGNCSADKAGQTPDKIAAVMQAFHSRRSPPELAMAVSMGNDSEIRYTRAGDMWLFGMLVYHAMTGEPYWDNSLSDQKVESILVDPSKRLPHEEHPLPPPIQGVLLKLLDRDPARRLTSAGLIAILEEEMPTYNTLSGGRTLNADGDVQFEQSIYLDEKFAADTSNGSVGVEKLLSRVPSSAATSAANNQSPAVSGSMKRDGQLHSPAHKKTASSASSVGDFSSGQRKIAASEKPDITRLKAEDDSLHALKRVLQTAAEIMPGRYILPDKAVVPGSIRELGTAVAVDIKGKFDSETALFFPDSERKVRHVKLSEKMQIGDIMPTILGKIEDSVHQQGSKSISLPPAIFIRRATSLREFMKWELSSTERQSALLNIWEQLAQVLKAFHVKGLYVRNINEQNVAQVDARGRQRWTFLDFGHVSRARVPVNKHTINARDSPPELAKYMLDASSPNEVFLNQESDIWMLGIVVYQVLTNGPYWDATMSDKEVLEAMNDPYRKLPHERKPVNNLAQQILAAMLCRNPSDRISVKTLIERLSTSFTTSHTIG